MDLKWTRIRVSEHLAHAEAYGRGPLTARNVRALCTAAAGDRFRLLATIPELSEHAETGKSCIYMSLDGSRRCGHVSCVGL